jgi:dihydropteroate synthase
MSRRAVRPAALRLRDTTFAWGERTYVMGILNVTPDSFSGDGLLASRVDAEREAVRLAVRMVEEGADILDVGGESTRPGHAPVTEEEERRRVLGVVRAVRDRLPGTVISIDTRKPGVAMSALDAGADMVNDVAASHADGTMARLVGERGVPYILGHWRPTGRHRSVVREVVRDLRVALDRAVALGCRPEHLVVDPGIGFGKTPEQNLALLHDLAALGRLGHAVLLGASRKSTIGRVLGLPPEERLEGTLATTALGIAGGIDIVRVHDVRANVRVARMSDAIVRGGWREEGRGG